MKIQFKAVNKEALDTPPEPVKFHLPDWYKKMPTNMAGKEFNASTFNKFNAQTVYTIKKCVPFLDYLTSGYLIRSPKQILIDPTEDNGIKNYQFRHSGDTALISTHPHDQCPIKIDGAKHHYIKFMNSWIVTTPPGYSSLFIQPLSIGNSKFVLFPGIVDTDKFDDPVNFPGYVTSKENFMVDCGEPLMVVIPFKRDNWKMEVSETVFDRTATKVQNKFAQYMANIYRDFFHSKKRYD